MYLSANLTLKFLTLFPIVEAGFYHTNRLAHPVFRSDRATEEAGALSKRGLPRLGQRRHQPRRRQRADRNRARSCTNRMDAFTPKHLVARKRNHDTWNPRAQTRACRPRAAMVDNRLAAWQQPIMRRRREEENLIGRLFPHPAIPTRQNNRPIASGAKRLQNRF